MKDSQLTFKLIRLCTPLFIVFLFLYLAASCSTMSDNSIVSDAYYNLGNAELDKGNNIEAEKYYFTALSYNSDNRSASYNLAVVYTLNGKFAEAEDLFKILLIDDPENVIIQNAYAWNMFRSGDLSRALEIYESVLSSNPAYDELRKNCIRVYMEVEDFDRASFHVSFLFEKSTLDSEMLFLQGELLFLQSNPEAEDWFIASVEKDSSNSESKSALNKILQTKPEEESIRELYEKLDDAEVLNPDLIYQFSLRLLALEEPVGYDYFREAVHLGYDVTQVKMSDINNLSDPIKIEFLNLLGEEFLSKYQ